MNPQEFLRSRGWFPMATSAYGLSEQITWWRHKTGREFPEHFAVWLERSGAVGLLTASQVAAAERRCGA